jgi:hypothetical protein
MAHGGTVGEKAHATQPLCENPLAITERSTDRFEINFISIVPKKTKTEFASPAPSVANASPPISTSPEPTAEPVRKRAGAPKTATRKVARKKKGSTPAKKVATRKAPKAAPALEPSDADVRLRAYFIAERRVQLALQGDPAMDWIEARKQLVEEASRRRAQA